MVLTALGLLISGCSDKTETQNVTTPEETPTSPIVIRTKATPPQWITKTPKQYLRLPELDRIRFQIEEEISKSDFGDSKPAIIDVELKNNELYVKYSTDRLSDNEIYIEMQKVASIVEDSFEEYQKPGRVTIKAVPNKDYNYETSLLWEEFVKLAEHKMPNSEWSKATTRSK